jgi:hypothetical protein
VLILNPVPRHEGVLGSGGITRRILELFTTWRRVVSFTPRPLYPQGKSPWYPLDRRQGRPQSRYGRGCKERNSRPQSGLEPPIIQPVAQRYTTELCEPVQNIRSIKFVPCKRLISIFRFNFVTDKMNYVVCKAALVLLWAQGLILFIESSRRPCVASSAFGFMFILMSVIPSSRLISSLRL